MHQLNTKIATLEEKLNNMSMSSSDKEVLDKEDMAKEDKVKEDVDKEKVLPRSRIWSDHTRIKRRHTITNFSAKSKSGRKN